ncbi:MAG: hypothetical protein MJA83_04085 [Gammaproteobacteria bacterium]|nr:hypothetical protein [Gammaproteobacteria bacterium]
MSDVQRNKWIVPVLGVMFLGPMLAAWIWFFYFQDLRTGSTINHGELINPPRLIQAGDFILPGSSLSGDNLFKDHWTIVHFGGAECAQVCKEALHTTRQARLALHKDIERVQRVYVSESAVRNPEYFRVEHPGLAFLNVKGGFSSQFAIGTATGFEQWIYLVDSRGFLMMRYKSDIDPKSIHKDLKRLLKYAK